MKRIKEFMAKLREKIHYWRESEEDRQFRELDMRVDRLITTLELRTAQLNQLLMSVETKFPGESRFDTALRYIQQAEQHDNPPEAGQQRVS